MEWTTYIDGYCERTGPEYWSEPINAVTNAAFLIAAAFMWVRVPGMPMARVLCAILAFIGIGSYLFHTHAEIWASIVDVTPIVLFILAYVFVANRDYWGMPLWMALIGTALFVPYALVTTPIFAALPFFDISSFYWPVPVLILAYAIGLSRRLPEVARGLAIGAGILIASLVFRSMDEIVCPNLPLGTHFMWHILNGVMLGWMIEVYRRHSIQGVPDR